MRLCSGNWPYGAGDTGALFMESHQSSHPVRTGDRRSRPYVPHILDILYGQGADNLVFPSPGLLNSEKVAVKIDYSDCCPYRGLCNELADHCKRYDWVRQQ